MFTFTKLRKAMTAFALCCLGITAMGVSPPALALNPNDFFQLDGNMIGGTTARPDWTNIFTGQLPNPGVTNNSLPTGFNSPTFVVDFFPATNNDNTLFTTGSKDTLNITPGWECKKTNNVNDKTDINNAYAVAYTDPTSGHLFVFFALDVASNDGTKDVGFWFLKDPSVSCPAGNGTQSFVGNHTDGDVLIVAEFTNGGRVNEIKAYRWNGGANGSLGTNPVASGGECDGTTFDVCAKVNDTVLNGTGTGNGDQVPWLVKTKTSNPQGSGYDSATDLDIGEFFEGGIDLTAAGISGCFNRYLADTRSSTTLGATIFDFTLGNFSNCTINASKSCVDTTFNAQTNQFTSTFSVVITNPSSSSGSVFDAKFNELNNPIPAGETCAITSNTGNVSPPLSLPLAITNSSGPVKVADSLAPGANATVGITCTGSTNGFTNAIHATAGSSAGQADIIKDATQTNSCTATVAGNLEIHKFCRGMALQGGSSQSDPITLKANVKVTVTNPASSNEQVQVDTVTDAAGSSNNVGTFTQVKCSDLTTPESDLVLSPGDTICFIGSYTPTTASLVNPPSTAFFTDKAKATGHGLAPGSTETFNVTSEQVSCFLCDADLDGSPDVIDCLTDNQCNTPH